MSSELFLFPLHLFKFDFVVSFNDGISGLRVNTKIYGPVIPKNYASKLSSCLGKLFHLYLPTLNFSILLEALADSTYAEEWTVLNPLTSQLPKIFESILKGICRGKLNLSASGWCIQMMIFPISLTFGSSALQHFCKCTFCWRTALFLSVFLSSLSIVVVVHNYLFII